MAGNTQPNDAVALSETVPQSSPLVPRVATAAVWTLFLLSSAVLGLSVWGGQEWAVPDVLVVDGLTTVMWVVVTFFSGIVHSFSRRYMAGDRHIERFYVRIFAFTLAVVTMTAADHVVLFAAAWLAMGLVMASLIGHVEGWKQARTAAASARRYFLASTGLLTVGLVLLARATGASSITGILSNAGSVSRTVALAAIGCLVLAAIIQSALFPFHTWLLSSMTAPTPASALMHAGFVNAGGILLTRFAPLLAERAAVMAVVFVVGACSALLGQALLLVQTDVKRELGASTIAQMGFMILQCGLGFFAAAITHLVLHGFYKAYLFLSSGSAVERTTPARSKDTTPSVPSIVVSLCTALGGGLLFMVLTGEGTELGSGLFLVFIVVMTTMHATRDILRRAALPPSARLLSVPLVVLSAIGGYAVLFNGVSAVIEETTMAKAPTELTPVHLLVAAVFVLGYLATELDWHRDSKRLYVALLNVSQPTPNTLLTQTEDYE